MTVPQEVAGWVLQRETTLPTHNATAYLYEHKKHKCPFLVVRDSKENCNTFSVSLRTIPSDSSGVFHMLEHLTLHGSKSYPIPDLFNELSKRSYATFMNAFTSREWTMFPFCSINEVDFHNNMDVYLDAVFHPCLEDLGFDVECYRLEFEDNDIEKPLKHSGVVYNEMCGANGQTGAVFHKNVTANLYPDSVSRFDFGGDPVAIREMNIEKVRQKHNEYYHPSNALFFTHGNFDIAKILQKVHDVIEPFDVSSFVVDTTTCHQEPWSEPRKAVFDIPDSEVSSSGAKKCRAGVAWICPDILDDKLMTDLTILDMALQSTNSSPMYKALIQSGLAERLLGSFSQSVKTSSFVISVDGISEENAENFEEVVLAALRNIVKEGFNPERIESVISHWELQEKTPTDEAGLNMITAIIASWIHGVDPFVMLDAHDELMRVRGEVKKNPRYFEDLVEKYLINNKSRLHFIAKPVPGYLDKFNHDTEDGLKVLKSEMSDERKKEIVQRSLEVKAANEAPKPVEKLPKISARDLSPEEIFWPPDWVEGDVSVFLQPVREMTHVMLQIFLDPSHPLLKLMSIYSSVCKNVGAGDLNDEELAIALERWTAGTGFTHERLTSVESRDNWNFTVCVTSSCLDENFDKMFGLVDAIVRKPHMDAVDKIKQRVTALYSGLRSSIQGAGLRIASSLATAGFGTSFATNEIVSGMTLFNTLRDIVEGEKWEELSQQLQTLLKEVVLAGHVRAAVWVSSEEQKNVVLPKILSWVKEFNEGSKGQFEGVMKEVQLLQESLGPRDKLFLEAPTNTNFTVMACDSVPWLHPLSAAMSALCVHLARGRLHEAIRVGLGAYGAMCRQQGKLEVAVFSSYRDQNAAGCLAAFKQVVEDFIANGITDEEIDELIVSCASELDAPIVPQRRGSGPWKSKTPKEALARWRLALFKLTKDDLIECAKILRENMKHARYCVFSNQSIAPPPEGFQVIQFGCDLTNLK